MHKMQVAPRQSAARIPMFCLKYAGYIFLFLFFCDQAAKHAIRRYGGFYVCNQGISWGIPVPSFIFWTIWIAIIAALLWFLSANRSSMYLSIGAAGILSGAFSNAFDRLYLGCVIDFIHLGAWPAFNLADAYVAGGGIMIVLNFKLSACPPKSFLP